MSVLKPQEPNLGRDGREVDSPLKKTEISWYNWGWRGTTGRGLRHTPSLLHLEEFEGFTDKVPERQMALSCEDQYCDSVVRSQAIF